MAIDKAKEFLTEAEKRRLVDIRRTINKSYNEYFREHFDEMARVDPDTKEEKGSVPVWDFFNKVDEELHDLMIEQEEIEAAADKRYMATLKGNYSKIVADTKEVLDSVDFKDFATMCGSLEYIKKRHAAAVEGKQKTRLREEFEYILETIELQNLACILDEYEIKEGNNELWEMALQRLKDLYKEGGELWEKEEIVYDRDGKPHKQRLGVKYMHDTDISKVTLADLYPEKQLKENIQAKRPKQALLDLTKVSSRVFRAGRSDIPINELIKIKVGRTGTKKNRRDVVTALRIDFDEAENNGITIAKKMTSYDENIHNAVISLLAAGNTSFTSNMLYKTMSGDQSDYTNINSTTRKKIKASIEKMAVTRVSIDSSDEAASYGIEKLITTDYLLNVKTIDVKINGREAEAYQLLDTPPLLKYASNNNQIARVDIKLLDVPLKKTDSVLAVRDYLIRRIEQAKNPHNQLPEKNIIKYEHIYTEAGIDDIPESQQKTFKSRTRQNTAAILDYFQKQKEIKGWEEIKKGKAFYSIKILL